MNTILPEALTQASVENHRIELVEHKGSRHWWETPSVATVSSRRGVLLLSALVGGSAVVASGREGRSRVNRRSPPSCLKNGSLAS